MGDAGCYIGASDQSIQGRGRSSGRGPRTRSRNRRSRRAMSSV